MTNQFREIRRAMEKRHGKKWHENPEVVFRVRMDRTLRTRLKAVAKAFASEEEPWTAESLAHHLLEVGVESIEAQVLKKEQEEKLIQIAPGGIMTKLKAEEEGRMKQARDVKTGGKKE